jgi:hypothetical protein
VICTRSSRRLPKLFGRVWANKQPNILLDSEDEYRYTSSNHRPESDRIILFSFKPGKYRILTME